MSTTNYTDIGYIAEGTEGTTPATPAFQILPTTGGSPTSSITTATSEVIRSDRQTDDLIVVDLDVNGNINYELSYAPYKPLILSLMQNSTTGSISETAATYASASPTIISKAGLNSAVSVGDVFTLSSALDSAIDGTYTCINNGTADQITVYPQVPAAMTDQSDVVVTATTIITNGANTADTYTFRKRALKDSTYYYWYYRGCKISSMSFNFSTGSILNGSFSIIGLTEEATTTAISGETTVEVQSYSIMNSVSSIGAIYVDGITLGTCSFSSLDINVDNQINSSKSIGVLGACGTVSFSLNVTGNVEVYFNNLDLYDKFLAAQDFSMTIILTDSDGNNIGINIPYAKFESLDTPIGGKDQFLMQSGSFKALRDATGNYMIKFSLIDA